jgi:hypothetical protein
MTDADVSAQGYDLGRAWRGGPLLPPMAWCSTLAQAIKDEQMAPRADQPVKAWTRNPGLRENPAWASYGANRARLAQLADNASRSLTRAIRHGRADRAAHYARKALRLRGQLETLKANKPRRWIQTKRRAAA